MSRELALLLFEFYCVGAVVGLVAYGLVEWQRGRDSQIRLWRD